MKPRVSVIIPTRGRPHLVPRAVRSALQQTIETLEVIVVVDGPDPATLEALALFSDERVRILELPERRGGSAARNAGVAMATAEWVAFLDDDDEWLPRKLEVQLALAASNSGASPTVVACRLEFRMPEGSYVGPRRLRHANEPLADYLLDRRSLFRDETAVLTSMLLAPRELLAAVPFDVELPRHQDADWLLRANHERHSELVFADQVLGIFHAEEQRDRVSVSSDWRRSLQWIRDRAPYITRRAYAGFVLSHVSAAAAREKAHGTFLYLLRDAFGSGTPRLTHVVLHCAIWALPQSLRGGLRRSLVPGRRRQDRGAVERRPAE